jgi:hypothetical protein
LNPLGRGERFQSVFIHPPFQGFPDASWVHARREFFDLFKPDGSTPIAAEALRRIAEMYQAEKETCGRPPDQRVMIRQEKLKPLMEAFRSWGMDQLSALMSNAKSPGPYATPWSAGMV